MSLSAISEFGVGKRNERGLSTALALGVFAFR